MFYDHPLLAVAFNSDIGDASQQQQVILTAGEILHPHRLIQCRQVFQGTVVVCNFAGRGAGRQLRTPELHRQAAYQTRTATVRR